MSIDVGALAQAIVNALINGLLNLLQDVPHNFLLWLADQLNTFWDDIFRSGINVLGTPLELTEDYGPAVDLGHALRALVTPIAVIAVALLGLRALWRSFSGGLHGSTQNDVVQGVLFALLLSTSSVFILAWAYQLISLASIAFGRFEYRTDFDPRDITNMQSDLMVTVFTILLMMIFGLKLVLRGAYRLILLMFLTPFAPIASICWAIPQLRWIASAYWVTIGGWMAGGILALAAVSLGVQIAAFDTFGPLWTVAASVSLLQLAYNMMTWLPEWAGSQAGIPGFGAHFKNPGSTGGGPSARGVATAGVAAAGVAAGAAAYASGGWGALGSTVNPALMSPAFGQGYD